MPQVILQKNRRPLRWLIPVAAFVIGVTVWLWPKPQPAKTAPAPHSYSVHEYSAPITAEDIKRAHEDVTAEGTVGAYTPQELTIKATPGGKLMKFKITSDTVFTKTAVYTKADGKDLRIGEQTQVLYNNATLVALKVAYGF